MIVSADTLKSLLTEPGHVNVSDFEHAEKSAREKNVPLDEFLIDEGFIKDEQLGKLLADHLGYRFTQVKNESIESEALNLIPELVAKKRGIVVMGHQGEALKVGMVNPGDIEARHFIEKKLGEKLEPYLITKKDLEGVLTKYRRGLREEFNSIVKKLSDPTLSREERDENTVRIVDTLLVYGYENQASDIHIEPYEEKISVRFRIDGIMHDVLDIPKDYYDLVLTRIKILGRMRTDEHLAAQDGKIKFNAGSKSIEIRVSIVPVTEGENVVMRILSSVSRRFDLTDLGLLGADFTKVNAAIKNPHGMILVTGPTGSGKTTSLYSMLKVLNSRDVHIATIEDPVEYDIEGITQIQVNQKTSLTFVNGLRSIVRQDPDIIMVGEIRDEETASIAVNSAMTGHLVLSTLHANDAATTLPRLLDMGIEPFLVSSTVNIIIAQRLVRRICESCRASGSLSEDEKKLIENDSNLKNIILKKHKDTNKLVVYRGAGCSVCGNTGYSGRIGIFEVLLMDEVISTLIVNRSTSDEIEKKAKQRGMTTMLEDGVNKVFQGITTLSEVYRVTRE